MISSMQQLNRLMTILAEQNKTAKLLSELTGQNICFLAHWCTAFSQSDEKTLFRIAEILHLDESGFIYMRKQDQFVIKVNILSGWQYE